MAGNWGFCRGVCAVFLLLRATNFQAEAKVPGDMFIKVCERSEYKFAVKSTALAIMKDSLYHAQFFMRCCNASARSGGENVFHIKCLDGTTEVFVTREGEDLNKYKLGWLFNKKGHEWVKAAFQRTFQLIPRLKDYDTNVYDCVNEMRPWLKVKGRYDNETKVANAYEILPDFCLPPKKECGCNYCDADAARDNP